MKSIFLNIFTIATLLVSVFSITSKNPVISVLFLISTFVLAACYIIFIGINFLGISYIIVYVGAIAVLFLYIIMMIDIKLTDILETGKQYTKNQPLALAIGILFIYIFFSLVPFLFNSVSGDLLSIYLQNISQLSGNLSIINNINSLDWVFSVPDTLFTNISQIESIGLVLYTNNALFLIILSIILLLSMFAVITLYSRSK